MCAGHWDKIMNQAKSPSLQSGVQTINNIQVVISAIKACKTACGVRIEHYLRESGQKGLSAEVIFERTLEEVRASSHKRPGGATSTGTENSHRKGPETGRSLLCPQQGHCAWRTLGGDRSDRWAGDQVMECLWIYSKGERKPRDGFEQGLVCSELCFKEMIMATV